LGVLQRSIVAAITPPTVATWSLLWIRKKGLDPDPRFPAMGRCFLSGARADGNEMVEADLFPTTQGFRMLPSLLKVVRKIRNMYCDSPSRPGKARRLPALELLEDRVVTSYVPTGTPGDVTNVIAGGQGESSSRTVAEMSNGDYRVVWEDHGVYTRLFGPNGAPLSKPVLVDSNPLDAEATVAINDQGTYVIAWSVPLSGKGGQATVFADRFNAKGVMTADVTTTAQAGDVCHQPAVAIDSAGDFVEAFTIGPPHSAGNIEFIMVNAAGHISSTNFATPSGCSDPSVAMTPSGKFVLAWSQANQGGGQDILAQRFNAKGVPQGSTITVATSTHAETQPSVAINAKGDFVVAYTQIWNQTPVHEGLINTTNDQTIVAAALFNAQGNQVGQTIGVAGGLAVTDSAYDPSAAMDAKGNFVIGYTLGGSYGSFVPGDGIPAVFANAYDITGALQQSAINLAIGGLKDDYHPSVALSASGHLAAVWENFGAKLQGDVAGTGVFTQTFKNVNWAIRPGLVANLAGL
jgi:hypothetical protein